jgi:hypothetical protein
MLFPDCGSGAPGLPGGGHGAPIAALDEDCGGFGIYGDKTRYATLRNQKAASNSLSSTSASANSQHNNVGVASTRGYETMRHLRTSIPSLVSNQPPYLASFHV